MGQQPGSKPTPWLLSGRQAKRRFVDVYSRLLRVFSDMADLDRFLEKLKVRGIPGDVQADARRQQSDMTRTVIDLSLVFSAYHRRRVAITRERVPGMPPALRALIDPRVQLTDAELWQVRTFVEKQRAAVGRGGSGFLLSNSDDPVLDLVSGPIDVPDAFSTAFLQDVHKAARRFDVLYRPVTERHRALGALMQAPKDTGVDGFLSQKRESQAERMIASAVLRASTADLATSGRSLSNPPRLAQIQFEIADTLRTLLNFEISQASLRLANALDRCADWLTGTSAESHRAVGLAVWEETADPEFLQRLSAPDGEKTIAARVYWRSEMYGRPVRAYGDRTRDPSCPRLFSDDAAWYYLREVRSNFLVQFRQGVDPLLGTSQSQSNLGMDPNAR